MAYNLEEQESIENLKGWWEKWGTPVTAVMAVVAVAFAGFNGWRWYKHQQTAKAAGAYAVLQSAIAGKDEKNIKSLSDGLCDKYGSTVFGPLAAFAAARVAMENGDLQGAADKLKWVVDKAGREEFEAIARVRLAGVYLDQKKADQALSLLESFKPKSDGEKAIVGDRLGDVYQVLGRPADARRAWTQAREATEDAAGFGRLLAIKIESLPREDAAAK